MTTMSRFHTFLVLVLPLLIIGTLTIHQNWFVGAETATLPTNISYAYTVNLTGIGVSPIFVVGLSSTRIAVAGFVHGVSAIAILDVSNPYEDPKIIQLYPLTGSPTALDVNGYSVKRVAVGTDKGEVVLLKVDEKGDIVGYVHRVPGTDFYVERLYIARTPAGGYKVITVVRDYELMERYIHVFDESSPSLFKIGPITGSVAPSMERYRIGIVAPLKVSTGSEVYYDASRVFVQYTPALPHLILNISYAYNATTILPASRALIMVLAYSKDGKVLYVYGVNADEEGVATIPIPVVNGTILNANISIIGINGGVLWKYTFIPELHVAVGYNYYLPSIILPSPPSTDDARKIFGTPPFLKPRYAVLDFSNVPTTTTGVYVADTSADDPGLQSAEEMQCVSGAVGGIFCVVKVPTPSKVVLYRVAISGKNLVFFDNRDDYVDKSARLVDALAYPNGDYIAVALQDADGGRLRVYSTTPSFRLTYIYPFASPIRRVLGGAQGATYAIGIVLGNGIQIINGVGYAVPLLRNGTEVVASVSGFVDGYIMPDFSTALLATSSSMVVISNLNLLVAQGAVTSLSAITAPTVLIKVVLPANASMDKVVATFHYPGGSKVLKPNRDGYIALRNIIPGVRYYLNISYEEPYINSTSIAIYLQSFRPPPPIEVMLRYREFKVTLNIVDPVTQIPIAPYSIVVDNRVAVEQSKESLQTLKLVYGVHNISIVPTNVSTAIYSPVSRTIFVDKDMNITFVLSRRIYNLRLVLVDTATGSSPIAPLILRLRNAVNGTVYVLPGTQYVNVMVFYGNVTVEVAPGTGYENVYTSTTKTISVREDSIARIEVNRVRYKVQLRINDPYTKSLIAPVDILINGTTVISNTTRVVEEALIPYGVWSITVKPSKGFENIYQEYTETVFINKSMQLVFTVPRALHTLSITIADDFNTLIAPVAVNIVGVENRTLTLRPGERSASISLPYGNYSIYIAPEEGYKDIYREIAVNITLTKPQSIFIRVQRKVYTLTIAIRDQPFGILVGGFDLIINGTKYADNFRGGNITLPYGTYAIQLIPSAAFSQYYETPKPVIVSLTKSQAVTIGVDRKRYTLTLYVREGATPVKDAEISIRCLETGATITTLITDENGAASTKLPFSTYEILIRHPSYVQQSIIRTLNADATEIVYLSPTPLTLIQRFLPVVIALVVVGIAIYAGFKLRAMIARRLATEEETF